MHDSPHLFLLVTTEEFFSHTCHMRSFIGPAKHCVESKMMTGLAGETHAQQSMKQFSIKAPTHDDLWMGMFCDCWCTVDLSKEGVQLA